MSILGNRVVRLEDPAFLTTGATYTADLDHPLLAGAAHAVFVRSVVAHGTLRSVEVADAVAQPGVLAVLTAADLSLDPLPPAVPVDHEAMARPWLARDVVRFVGEPLAVVVAETLAKGVDAAELIWADIDPLPPVVDPEDAVTDEVLLFPEAGTNVASRAAAPEEAPEGDAFAVCEVVVRHRLVNQRLAACPLEGRAAAAAWSDGELWLWLSSQGVHGVHRRLRAVYGLDGDAVHVVAPDVGGGFGPKINATPEDLVIPELARRVGRPVRWAETRSENLVAMGQGRGQIHHVEIGGRRDGTIEAYRLSVLADAGAYPDLGAWLPTMTCSMAPGVYRIPRVEARARSVVTNTVSTDAYRGAGRPEATAAIERAVDLFAAEVGMDPVEVRRRNLVAPGDVPYTTPTGAVYDSGDYERALDLALEAAGYEELRAEQARRRADDGPSLLGIGVSCYVEVTAGPYAGKEWGSVRVLPDGTAEVATGISPHGQGHHTALAMVAASQLGIPHDRIRLVHSHTDLVARGGGTNASRSLQLGGPAVLRACEALVERARRLAAERLEVGPEEVAFDPATGRFHGADPEAGLGWEEVAAAAGDDGIAAEEIFEAPYPTYPFGAHVAVVEVDRETGVVRLARHVACDDAGRILNPLLAEGQRHGGIAQGAAQALLEEVRYDSDGNPVTATLADYPMISATELPSFELVTLETPTAANPLGAKGIGESGTIGAAPAVHNAVVDALAHLGVRHLDMPATPERVWRAIAGATGELQP